MRDIVREEAAMDEVKYQGILLDEALRARAGVLALAVIAYCGGYPSDKPKISQVLFDELISVRNESLVQMCHKFIDSSKRAGTCKCTDRMMCAFHEEIGGA